MNSHIHAFTHSPI